MSITYQSLANQLSVKLTLFLGIKTLKANNKTKIDNELKEECLHFVQEYSLQLENDQNLINTFIFTNESTFKSGFYQNLYTRTIDGHYGDLANYSNHNTITYKVYLDIHLIYLK